MNDVKQTTPLERLIKVASAGFLLYGYHGYSLYACAEAMNLPEKKLYGYVNDKLDLAHQIMQALRVEAREVICANQWPFSLCNGLQLAVLPSKLWVANDKALQLKIRAYYDDWRLLSSEKILKCSAGLPKSRNLKKSSPQA